MNDDEQHGNMSDADIEALRKLSLSERKRNGQTTAFCTACGEEIKGVAYVVETRDPARLLQGGLASFILHYDCIASTFKSSRRA